MLRRDRNDTVMSVARHDAITVMASGTARDARIALAGRTGTLEDPIIAIDPEGCFAGIVEPARLLSLTDDAPIASAIRRDWPTVAPSLDQEHAAELAVEKEVSFLPVVQDGRLVGLVNALALLRILSREHHEDMNRFVGVIHANKDARAALENGVVSRAMLRLPWLIAGLMLSSVATVLMKHFEEVLAANLIVALFIPAIIYITDAVGTQTEAAAVRGLSLTRRPLATIMLKEIATGALIGAMLGLLAFAMVWAVFGDLPVAAGVAASLMAGAVSASMIGLLLPWALSKLNVDPAFGSGPMATVLQTVLTVLLYFEIMAAVLGL